MYIYIYTYIHAHLLSLFSQYTHHFGFLNNLKLINSSSDQNLKSLLKKMHTSSVLLLRPIRSHA